MFAHATILAAEDQESAAVLLRMALEGSGLRNPLVIVEDGQCAVDYLKGEPPYGDRVTYPLPGLLLLDLNMPRMDGFDLLVWLRKSREFCGLPAVVLSSSPREADIKRAKELGAREYLTKPCSYHELTGMLKDMAEKWLPPPERVATPESKYI